VLFSICARALSDATLGLVLRVEFSYWAVPCFTLSNSVERQHFNSMKLMSVCLLFLFPLDFILRSHVTQYNEMSLK